MDINQLNAENQSDINYQQPFILGPWLITPALNSIKWINEDKASEYTDQPSIQKLTPKVMALCVYLTKNHGRPVSQTDIADAIWPQRVISDSSIYQAIAQLRKALNCHQTDIDHIERISGKGYRLLLQPKQNLEQIKSKKKPSTNKVLEKKHLKRSNVITLAGLITFALLVLSGWYYSSKETANEQQLLTIAVLPTNNLTQPKIESLSSFNQLLISDLVSQTKLKFIYLRKDIETIEAKTRLLTSIQQYNSSLLASVQLVNQENNEIIWAQNFKAKKTDMLVLKNTIVEALVARLLPTNTTIKASVAPEQDPHYESYILARHLWDKRNVSALNQAKVLYQKILKQSPNHLGSLIGLCHTHIYLSVYSKLTSSQAHENCQPLVTKALEINANNGEVLTTQAILLNDLGQFEEAEQLFKRAAKVAPNYAMGHYFRSKFLRQTGQYSQALKASKSAFSLDPLSPIIIRGLAYSYLNMRQVEKARSYYQRALIIEPHYSHRAIEELDFLPLNTKRAQAFIQWLSTEPSNIANHRVYQLTQALVWLSLGDVEKAQNLITNINQDEVNPGFLFYSQSALAMAKGKHEQALKKLTARLELAPDIAIYAMPYISALKNMKLSDEALTKFRQYFPTINVNTEIKSENVGQFIFLATLLGDTLQFDTKSQIIEKLTNYFSSKKQLTSDKEKVYWYALIEQHQQLKLTIERLFENGWLPDYNDNIFSEHTLKAMYKKAGGNEQRWHELLQKNRQIEK